LYTQFDNDNNNPIRYCLDVILKEAREEDRLVKQIFYTMASAYTNNPLNLAINAPSGEGKTYVLQKVGDMFPKEDVIFLAGMTDKALFHGKGDLVVKNKDNGEYETLEDKIAKIDSDIQDKESEILLTKDNNLKQGLRSMISSWKKERKELIKESKKLIDLSHKILVFLDSPRAELFNALMPLLSHDRYEVEYQFVDTHNGIKTKSNILRGWPAVIFAQAIDYSHYQRYPEIQRRFIITNPKMTTQKYEQAVDLISDKYGLPDFAYQAKIVSDLEKERASEIILEIKQNMLAISDRVEPGKNNVIIPFNETVSNLLPKEKAFDMITANRFFGFLSLLPIINIDKRPRILLRRKGNPVLQTIPFALFEDLQEATFLMEHADGVRPYILEWYYDIFLKAYESKKEPDSQVNSNDQIITEKRIALTTEQLVEKTKEIHKQSYTKKKILETYITPLSNQGYIDKTVSELDKRAKIYYPVKVKTENRKLFDSEQTNNLIYSDQSLTEIENKYQPPCNCAYYDYFEGLEVESLPIALANLLLSEELSSFMTSSWICGELVSENMPLSFM
jgi:DNA-binding MarR family transcriptional regulator